MRYLYSITAAQYHLIAPLSQHPEVGFEIRLDTFDTPPDAAAIRAATKRPLLATWRSVPHLGKGDPQHRATTGWAARRACAEAGFDYVDLELDEPHVGERLAWLREHGVQSVLSHHELTDNAGLDAAFDAAQSLNADVVKIIGTGRETADLKRQRNRYAGATSLVHFYMGADFAATRILSLLYGAPFTFLTPDPSAAVAPGQLTLADVTQTFRVDQLRLEDLMLFSVIGSPIGHSKSPAFHNPRLKALAENSVFLALPAKSDEDLHQLIETFPELIGMACTKPMKEHAFRFTEEFLDDDSHALGAVNTLVKFRSGWGSTNTDMLAMEVLLKHRTGVVRVIGYGGLGKAVVSAALAMGRRVQVCNRSPERLADAPEAAEIIPWSERGAEGASIFIQATSVGMAPDVDAAPLDRFPKSATVLIETIYNPSQTRLMDLAARQGLEVVDGHALFEGQAKIQNECFLDVLRTWCPTCQV